MLLQFKNKLRNEKVTVIEEEIIEIIPELVVDKIPGTVVSKQGHMRDELFDFEPFFIKSHDGGKFGQYSSPISEIRREVKAWHDFAEKIPIVEKIAILRLNKFERKVFLVEKKLEAFNEKEWQKKGLYEKAVALVDKAREEFPGVGDFQLTNLGLDSDTGEIKFFDVFPQ